MLQIKIDDVVMDEDFAFARRNAMAYLNEYQLDAVLRLHALIEKEDFVSPMDQPIHRNDRS